MKIQKGSGLASHGYTGPKGPLRTGFGANQNSNRLEAGASYWGIMEMSGNLWEQCVSTSEEGSKFEGNHGDGEIQIGMSNVSSWPGKGAGSGFRGGGWNSGISLNDFRDLATSDRYFAFFRNQGARETSGGRGVRKMDLGL